MYEDILLNFYWDALIKAETIIFELEQKQLPITSESKLIKGLAIAELIRNHVKFYVIQPEKEITKTKKIGFISLTSTEENTNFQAPTIVIKDPNGSEHKVEAELIKQILGSDYNTIILKEDSNTVPNQEIKEIPIIDFSDEEYETEEKQEELIPEEPESSKIDHSMRLPIFEKDGRYSDDIQSIKLWDTFTYNHHALTLKHQDQDVTIHFYVYPLAMKQNELASDIMAIAESDDLCRANVSRGNVSAVELNFNDISFTIRGSFQNGKFNSVVVPMDQAIINTMSEQMDSHEATNRTSTTYAQSEYHGIIFNIFPAKFKQDEYGNYVPANGSHGYTPAGIVIERNNLIEVLTPTSEGTFHVLGNNKEDIIIETYWNCPKQGHTFNYRFEN